MRKIPRGVKALSAVSFFNDVASEMVYPLLPALVSRLGGGALVLGALDGAAELTAAGLKWVSGRLADRTGWQRPLILGGYLLAVVVRPIIAVASAVWQVVGLRVADRIGKGLRTPARDALITELTLAESRGRAFGFHRAADHLGAVLGAVAAWALLSGGVSVRGVIGWSAVPGVLALGALSVALRRQGRQDGRDEPAVETVGAVETVRTVQRHEAAARVFWAPILALAGIVLARVPETLLLLRLQHLGVAVPLIPLAWGALHVVRSGASYPGGVLADRHGPRVAIAAGGVLAAAVLALLSLRLVPAAAVAVFLAFGLVAGLTESAERSLVARLAPARPGRSFGAYHAVTGFVALPAGLVFGGLYQEGGGSLAFGLSAGAVAVATIGWLLVAPASRAG